MPPVSTAPSTIFSHKLDRSRKTISAIFIGFNERPILSPHSLSKVPVDCPLRIPDDSENRPYRFLRHGDLNT